jgi:uncharacterized membrane protein (UPF0182 family)
VNDDIDPVLQVWRSAFPDLFEPFSTLPAGLADHLRYPEELFRIQTSAYSKYQLPPNQFFDRIGAWSVAQAPPNQAQPTAIPTVGLTPVTDANNQQRAFSDESNSARFVPYYSMFQAPNQTSSTFELYRPFVQFSTNDDRRELQAFMTASSDPATYGQLIAYTVSNDLPNGPLQVANTMSQDPLISQQVTLIDQRGSQVVLGDLQMVPVAGGIVWIRPMFSEPQSGGQPLMKFVLASYNGSATFGESIGDALGKLFPGFNADLGDRVNVDGTVPGSGTGDTSGSGSTTSTTAPSGASGPSTSGGTATTSPGGTATTPEELLAEANRLFGEADAALKTGDLGSYQAKVTQARQLVQQAFDVMQASTSTTASSVPSTSVPSATTPSASPTTAATTAGASASSAPPTG